MNSRSTNSPPAVCHLCGDGLDTTFPGSRYCEDCIDLVYDPDFLRTDVDDPITPHFAYPAMKGAYAYDRNDEEYDGYGI